MVQVVSDISSPSSSGRQSSEPAVMFVRLQCPFCQASCVVFVDRSVRKKTLEVCDS